MLKRSIISSSNFGKKTVITTMTRISTAQIRNIITEKQLSMHRFLFIDPINPRNEIPDRRIPTARKIKVAPFREFFEKRVKSFDSEQKPLLSFASKYRQVLLELLMKSHLKVYQRNHFNFCLTKFNILLT